MRNKRNLFFKKNHENNFKSFTLSCLQKREIKQALADAVVQIDLAKKLIEKGGILDGRH